jgi:SEC-C motif-containing protein
MSDKINPNTPCPCHSGQKYKKCCRPYHQGRQIPDVVTLMRARYSAYALHKPDFIMETTHSKSPHHKNDIDLWRAEISVFCQNTTFVSLDILAHDENSVTFKAGLEQRGKDASFVEHSLFEQEDGIWMYLRGETLKGSDKS